MVEKGGVCMQWNVCMCMKMPLFAIKIIKIRSIPYFSTHNFAQVLHDIIQNKLKFIRYFIHLIIISMQELYWHGTNAYSLFHSEKASDA